MRNLNFCIIEQVDICGLHGMIHVRYHIGYKLPVERIYVSTYLILYKLKLESIDVINLCQIKVRMFIHDNSYEIVML